MSPDDRREFLKRAAAGLAGALAAGPGCAREDEPQAGAPAAAAPDASAPARADLAYLVFQQFRLILGIAAVYGHAPTGRERFNEALSCLAYSSGVGIGKQGIATVLGSATVEGGVVAERIGARMARERLARIVPIVGALSGGALNYVSRRLTVPPAEAYGVASFYALFSTEPRPKTIVHVCDDIACRVNGAENLCRELEESMGPAGVPAEDGATWLRSPCLGQCERDTAVLFQRFGEDPRAWTLPGPALPQAIVTRLREAAVDRGAPRPGAVGSEDDRGARRLGPGSAERTGGVGGHNGLRALIRRALYTEPALRLLGHMLLVVARRA